MMCWLSAIPEKAETASAAKRVILPNSWMSGTGRCGKCGCECERADLEDARLEQRVGRGIEGAAGREHIIDQPNACRRVQAARGTKRSTYVLAPFATDELGLVARVMNALEGIGDPRTAEALRNSACDGIDMVEAPPTATAGMERDAHDEIGSRGRFRCDASAQFDREMVDRQADHNGRTKGTSSGLEAGNPSPHGAFVANQRAATVQGAALHETSGAALEYAVIQIRFIGRAHPGWSPTPRTAIHHSPPGQPAVASRAERARSSRERRVAFEAARPRDGVQQNRDSVHRKIARAGAASFGTECAVRGLRRSMRQAPPRHPRR